MTFRFYQAIHDVTNVLISQKTSKIENHFTNIFKSSEQFLMKFNDIEGISKQLMAL